jgi:uncharacterized membrane protein
MKRIVLLLIIFSGISYAAELTGKISNQESIPVSGAKIIIFNEISVIFAQRIFTDRNGSFKVELAPGNYLVWITKDGFQTYFEQVLLPSGKFQKRVNWIMHPKGDKNREEGPSLKYILRHSGR